MSDLISKSALIEEFRKCHISFNGTPMEESDMMISYRSLARVINRQPQVEAKSVVHGEWMGCDMQVSICSNCREVFDIPINRNHWNLCPNCGADMRGEKHD